MSHHLISNSEFQEIYGEINHDVFLVINLTGVNEFSVIFQCLDVNNEPVNFPAGSKYRIEVSNDAYNEPDPNPYSYYNVMIVEHDVRWIHIREVLLSGVSTDNSFTELNQSSGLNILHFKYCRFVVDAMPNVKVRIITSSR